MKKTVGSLLISGQRKIKGIGSKLSGFIKNESGMGTIELVLLILVLVGLAILFKNSIGAFFDNLVKGV